MSHQAVASIKASDGTVNYCLGILSSLSLNDEDKLSFAIGNCLITFNKHIVCSLSPWISDILKDECCRLEGHVFISLPEETSLKGFLSLKAVIETGMTHELSDLDKDELYFAIKLLGMDIQLKKIVTVNECSSDEVDFDAQQHESIISTEDMFTHNVDMDSEQTRSVDDMEADDTNNNKTLEPRTGNGMEKNSDLNKDLEVFEEINMVNSMDNAQHNLKPVFKKCEEEEEEEGGFTTTTDEEEGAGIAVAEPGQDQQGLQGEDEHAGRDQSPSPGPSNNGPGQNVTPPGPRKRGRTRGKR